MVECAISITGNASGRTGNAFGLAFLSCALSTVCGFWSIFENCENNGKIIVEIVQ